jgi:hypothetical protein
VAKAVNSANPKRRYATPADARVMIFLHWLLPDAAWEWLMRTALAAAARNVAQRRKQA